MNTQQEGIDELIKSKEKLKASPVEPGFVRLAKLRRGKSKFFGNRFNPGHPGFLRSRKIRVLTPEAIEAIKVAAIENYPGKTLKTRTKNYEKAVELKLEPNNIPLPEFFTNMGRLKPGVCKTINVPC
jgi:hypothetical protein